MQEEVVSFPLYTEAIKFFHHEEGMVRIAVRTITLSVYNGESKLSFCFHGYAGSFHTCLIVYFLSYELCCY